MLYDDSGSLWQQAALTCVGKTSQVHFSTEDKLIMRQDINWSSHEITQKIMVSLLSTKIEIICYFVVNGLIQCNLSIVRLAGNRVNQAASCTETYCP